MLKARGGGKFQFENQLAENYNCRYEKLIKIKNFDAESAFLFSFSRLFMLLKERVPKINNLDTIPRIFTIAKYFEWWVEVSDAKVVFVNELNNFQIMPKLLML